VIGVSIASLALLYLALGASARTNTEIIAVLTLSGIGLGTAFPSMMVATQNAAAGGNLGIATANHAFFRSLGGAVGVSMFGAIIFSMLAAHIDAGPGRDLNDNPAARPGAHRVQPILGRPSRRSSRRRPHGCFVGHRIRLLEGDPAPQHASGQPGGHAAGDVAAEYQPLPAHPAFPIWWRPIEKTGPDKPWGAWLSCVIGGCCPRQSEGRRYRRLRRLHHLIRSPRLHEAIRQERRDLWLVRMTPDLIYDQLIGMGCVRKLTSPGAAIPASAHCNRLRDAVETAGRVRSRSTSTAMRRWPNAYEAGAAGLPFAMLRGYRGVSSKTSTQHQGDHLPLHRREAGGGAGGARGCAVIHAQKADRKGNVLIEGILGVQRKRSWAPSAPSSRSRRSSRIWAGEPERLHPPILDSQRRGQVPGGAHPSYRTATTSATTPITWPGKTSARA